MCELPQNSYMEPKDQMTLYEGLSLFLELAVLVTLWIEYLWGRPDLVIKNEEKQRKRLRKAKFDMLIKDGEMK